MSYKGLEDDIVVLNHQHNAAFEICQMHYSISDCVTSRIIKKYLIVGLGSYTDHT